MYVIVWFIEIISSLRLDLFCFYAVIWTWGLLILQNTFQCRRPLIAEFIKLQVLRFGPSIFQARCCLFLVRRRSLSLLRKCKALLPFEMAAFSCYTYSIKGVTKTAVTNYFLFFLVHSDAFSPICKGNKRSITVFWMLVLYALNDYLIRIGEMRWSIINLSMMYKTVFV